MVGQASHAGLGGVLMSASTIVVGRNAQLLRRLDLRRPGAGRYPLKGDPVKRILITATVAALAATACGGGGGKKNDAAPTTEAPPASRTIEIDMIDIAYQPATPLSAKSGETIRFVFHNKGSIRHDAFVGDAAAQADHEKEMREKESGHDMGGKQDQDAITVDPGKTAEFTHTFDRAGTLEIACHEAGHYAAGMKIAVTVT